MLDAYPLPKILKYKIFSTIDLRVCILNCLLKMQKKHYGYKVNGKLYNFLHGTFEVTNGDAYFPIPEGPTMEAGYLPAFSTGSNVNEEFFPC
ncbi:hypothetical protein CEXT_87361 [Caerostris extrusa]|uniref:Uncharacterized protein n=1 Tax=Caerostris extrusa TaxID=172846 RepID=A0AAV4WKG0_CAEEX|nr:hypothetical protein CEXT_87361 [Caerostris extrusa]